MMDITILINGRGEDQAEEEVVLLDKSLKQLTKNSSTSKPNLLIYNFHDIIYHQPLSHHLYIRILSSFVYR